MDNREKYLESLAERYQVDIEIVRAVSDSLGEAEDLDGLPNVLSEYKAAGLL